MLTNITVIRRNSLLYLLHTFSGAELAAGALPRGIEKRFAERLQIGPSMLSQIKTARPISNKLARQIEQLSGLEAGWLDVQHQVVVPTDAEESFVDLCRQAWHAQNAKGKRELRRLMIAAAEVPEPPFD